MKPDRALFDYVCGSAVRMDVLSSLGNGPKSTGELIDDVDASESAVYDALAGLEDRSLVHQPRRKTWATTGAGGACLALVDARNDIESLLGTDLPYWRDHDVGALPQPFRARLHELAGAEIVRSKETDPQNVVRLVGRTIERAESLKLVAPVYHERYEEAVREIGPRAKPRIIVDTSTLHERMIGALSDRPVDFPGVTARVADVNIALGVTDERLFLSLPTLDGEYDARTEVVADTDAARGWGHQLFDYLWDRATPAESYVANHPELALE